MRICSLIIMLSLFAEMFYGCKKNGANSSSTIEGLYIAGTSPQSLTSVIWHNGTLDTIPNEQNVSTLALSPAYIYTTSDEYGAPPAYWKDSVEVNVPNAISLIFAGVSGFSTFAAGTCYDPNGGTDTCNCYWINNVPKILIKSTVGIISAAKIVGNDFYVLGIKVGYDSQNNYHDSLVYWKNGEINYVADVTQFLAFTVLTIAVWETDVYVCGFIDLNGAPSHYVIWKNGEINNLPDSIQGALNSSNAIAINGSGLYIAGSLNNQAGYWHNGAFTYLPGGYETAGILLNGFDIYVIGVTLQQNGLLWINGIEQQLPIYPSCLAYR
jgi:hypothetical protein